MSKENEILKKIYYDPTNPGSLGGVERLFLKAKKLIPSLTRNRVKTFLKGERTYTLHKPARKNFYRNKTVVGSIDQQWQIDLADMTDLAEKNDGYRYLLTCIDCFSRFAWVIPVKTKYGVDIKAALKKLFKLAHPRKPKRIHSDKGKEFFNTQVKDFLEKLGIKLFASESTFKAALVERFNRTLKTKIWHYFTANNTYRFLEILPQIVESYNNSVHRTIGMAPSQVEQKHVQKLWHRMYAKECSKVAYPDSTDKGNVVRINKHKTLFEKGYLPNWSEETFKIDESVPNSKRVYKLKDELGEELTGNFYPEELQKVNKSVNDLCFIEKVIRKRKRGKVTELFVKWKGWPDKFNSWVTEKEVVHYDTKK